ncbi:sensor histidine kinase [Nocardioides silvaticus]|uniref:histidine kinase n=1 Tax=Nocardioides silvaticus TaxID=2201891 RepID=A0A316TDE8_9ACTN|nr:histidine kinase [Nocardioides silvaticus]PWN01501.1 sensor histidine kinase [Nocardioides silvaticus]
MSSLLAPIPTLGPTPVDRATAVGRLRLTLVGTGQALLGLPVGLAIGILWLLAVPLTLAVVGLLLALLVVPTGRALADVHRRFAGSLLDDDVESGYLPDDGRSVLGRPLLWVRDPARWRDFAHLWFSATGGFVLSGLPTLLLVAPVVHVVGLLVDPGTVWLLLVFLDGPMLLTWWLVTPHLLRGRAHADRTILGHSRLAHLEQRVVTVEETRAESLDHQAAEIRRIERDLHDGAQARIAAVGMNVGLAEKLIGQDPDAAAALLREARETTLSALEDLRSVVRGIHPPALADRGLVGAVEALALPIPIPVTVSMSLPAVPPPVESAAYFAVAECLANVVKHADATRAWVTARHDGERLLLAVGDDGRGGAAAVDGGGLAGVARRLAAFDGTMAVASPDGGPTVVRMEVPCPTA